MQSTQDVAKIGQELSQYKGGYSNLKPSKIHTLNMFFVWKQGHPNTQAYPISYHPVPDKKQWNPFWF